MSWFLFHGIAGVCCKILWIAYIGMMICPSFPRAANLFDWQNPICLCRTIMVDNIGNTLRRCNAWLPRTIFRCLAIYRHCQSKLLMANVLRYNNATPSPLSWSIAHLSWQQHCVSLILPYFRDCIGGHTWIYNCMTACCWKSVSE